VKGAPADLSGTGRSPRSLPTRQSPRRDATSVSAAERAPAARETPIPLTSMFENETYAVFRLGS
jgi:hypothetical protein